MQDEDGTASPELLDQARRAVRNVPISPENYAAMLAQLREQQERERAAITEFLAGALTADPEKFARGLHRIANNSIALRSAFRQIGRHPDKVPMRVRKAFLTTWFNNADHFRNEVNDDLVLISALRALLPPYRGNAVMLYRGDSTWNRKRRTYGVCWSRSQIIAGQHAENWAKHCTDGAVLLETFAPPDAIICGLMLHMESIEEEYIIDRRHLGRVMVVRRYRFQPQEPVGAAD